MCNASKPPPEKKRRKQSDEEKKETTNMNTKNEIVSFKINGTTIQTFRRKGEIGCSLTERKTECFARLVSNTQPTRKYPLSDYMLHY